MSCSMLSTDMSWAGRRILGELGPPRLLTCEHWNRSSLLIGVAHARTQLAAGRMRLR